MNLKHLWGFNIIINTIDIHVNIKALHVLFLLFHAQLKTVCPFNCIMNYENIMKLK